MAIEIREIMQELARATTSISDVQLSDFIQKINHAERIFVYGTGRSGLMLKSFAMRLMQMNYTAYVVGETTTPSVQKGDLLIVASASGETDSVCQAVKKAVTSEIEVITITANHESTLARLQEPLMFIESATKFTQSNSTIQPLGSLFEQVLLILFDSIILKIAKNKADINTSMAKQHASIE